MITAQSKKTIRRINSTRAIIAAVAAFSTGLARAGTDTVPAGNGTSLRTTLPPGATSHVTPTVSMSGSTAMRNFIISPGMTFLSPTTGNSITLGPTGDEITYSLGASSSLQFAQKNFNTTDVTTGTNQSHSGLRIEWHEQGSVEGMLEMADSQINDSIYGNLIYNPTTGNATYINQNKFGGTGAAVFPPNNLGGHQLNNNPNDTTRDAQAQSPVRMAISDVTATQGFAKGGAGANNSGAYILTPTASGYGKGNPALTAGSLGTPGARAQLQDESVLNMTAGAADPNGGTFGTGAWNTAGVANLNSKRVAETATLFTANPGTGLTHLNRTDAQWLQMTGRLKNGADFNMTTRDVGSGTRNVAALNTGVDPSWATGENDAGNGNALTGGTDQTVVGAGLTFSNKTAGGAQLRPVVQRSRMAIGTLSMSDGIGNFNNGNNAPLRALDYRDDADDTSNNSNGAAFKNWNEDGSQNPTFTTGDLPSNTFVRASATSITNGSYVIYQNEQFVTVRKPDADYATDKVKGDNTGHDVQDVRDNVLNSGTNILVQQSVSSPADALLDNSFILPQLMLVNKPTDGLNQSAPTASPDTGLRSAFLADTRAAKFNPDDPTSIKAGSSAKYGANVAHAILNADGTITNVAPLGGAIDITANNYFFGDFKRDNASPTTGNREVRDFSDLAVAQKAQARLFQLGTTTWDDAASPNSTSITDGGGFTFSGDMAFTPTKGDLIALGDFNSDGKFDGKDLYLFAHGAALADNTGSTTLSGGSSAFADKVRSDTVVLRKNAALDLLDSAATSQQKIDASANLTNDPSGINAFNKRDVNRDGNVDFVDAVTSDKFFNQNYTNLDQSLAATANVRVGDAATPFNLVDAELNDTGNIDQTDLNVINTALVGSGKETWTGALEKTGAGSVSVAYTTGTFKVNTGAALQINAGTVTAGGTADPFTDNTGSATNGNHVAIANNAAFNIAGVKHIGNLTGTGNTTIQAGGTLVAGTIAQNKISMKDSSKLITASPIGSWNGSSYTGVTGLVATGYNGGGWTGTTGIVAAETNATSNNDFTSLAAASAADALGIGATQSATWAGQTVHGSDSLVMYTYGGDADLNGFVDLLDYGQIDGNVNANLPSPGWFNGDFNYDGLVDLLDYGIIDGTINTQGAAFPTGAGVGISAIAVPEPGSVGLVFAALGLSLPRASRWRRR